jgi:nucleotide-binding universal stress UspA family protein
MRNAVTYNTNAIPDNCMFLEENCKGRTRIDLFLPDIPEISGLVDSRVPVKCEVVNKHSTALLINRYRYPGFNHNKLNNESFIMHAKKLGKTYKSQAFESAKGNLTVKKQNAMKGLQIKKILVPTDFSETGLLALEHATFMASLFKAQLYLLHVIEAFEYMNNIYEPQVMAKDTEGVHDIVKEKLEKLAAKITKEKGINIKILVESGRPSSGIAEAVKENNIDLILMGTHGVNGFEEYFIGSNAHKVVNISPCPVITVQTQAKKMGFRNIVMPIDNSLHSRQKVNYVSALASKYGSKVHILGLLNSEEKIEEKKINIKLDSVENVIKKTGVPYIRKLKKGKNIAMETMEYSNKVKADLIVIMTDHESNLTGMFLGSLSKQIVNHSKVPVMSIKPDEHYETYQEIW